MHVMLECWNDEKMDVLAAKVDGLGGQTREQRQEMRQEMREQRQETKAEFTAVRGEIGAVRGELAGVRGELAGVRSELAVMQREMNARFEGMQRTMLQAAVAMSTAFIAGFAALTGLVATQL